MAVGVGVLALALAALETTVSRAQTEDTNLPAYRTAYASTMKCFVVNGVLVSDAEEKGDAAKAKAFNTKAHQSYNLAFGADRRIGLSDEQIGADITSLNATELPSMIRDTAYFAKAVAECRTLGLM